MSRLGPQIHSDPAVAAMTAATDEVRRCHVAALVTSEPVVPELPGEAWSKVLSFVMRSSQCVAAVGAISPRFGALVRELYSWEGASVCLRTDDLRRASGRDAFESFVLKWSLCSQAVVDFKDAHVGAKRFAAERCFDCLGQHCSDITHLRITNWQMFKRSGLHVLNTRFSALRHLEISGCDTIGSYNAAIPFLQAHSRLLSFRATFDAKASASIAFVDALPTGLRALGFINIDEPELVERLLRRCPDLEHLWLAATGKWVGGRAAFARAFSVATNKLRTLALPSLLSEEACRDVAAVCPELQLLCRMRVGVPAFGSGVLANDFEVLPEGQGTVLRRFGCKAELSANGSLWAPHWASVESSFPAVETSQLRSNEKGCGKGGYTTSMSASSLREGLASKGVSLPEKASGKGKGRYRIVKDAAYTSLAQEAAAVARLALAVN